MKAIKGAVLGPLEIVNEYGIKYKFKNNYPTGTKICIYINNEGEITNIDTNIPEKLIPITEYNKNKKN